MSLEKLETVDTDVNCQGQNSFSPSGSIRRYNNRGGKPTFQQMTLSNAEGFSMGLPGENLHKTFQLDPGGCASEFCAHCLK